MPHRKVKNPQKERNAPFVDDFEAFYESYFSGTAKAIRKLADIQKKYPAEYILTTSIPNDPDAIMKLTQKFPPQKQLIIMNLLYNAGAISKKMQLLFSLKPKEQLELADELESITKNFSKLIKKGN